MTSSEEKEVGWMMRALRISAGEKSGVEDERLLDKRNTVERWEHGSTSPTLVDFWEYVRALRHRAKRNSRTAEFEEALHRLMRKLDRDFEDATDTSADDSRTPGERAQDLEDYSRRDVCKTVELGKVAKAITALTSTAEAPGRLVLPRAEVEAPESWRSLDDKAFEICLVFPTEAATISVHRRSPGTYRSPYLLSVDLRDQQYAIYNEKGKKLLRREFVNSARERVLAKASSDIQDFLMHFPETTGHDDLSWRTLMDGDLVPLRWASAGILPIAHCLRKNLKQRWEDDGDWVVLFFRDIPPLGLNVGNGASEAAAEYRDVEELIAREFAEEMILLKHEPKRNESVEQVVFFDPEGGRALNESEEYSKFFERHQQLRKEHDDLKIVEAVSEHRYLKPLDTPFAVRVMDGRESISRCRNIIPTVNPSELGIEIIRPCRFDLYQGEWLMDGEITPSSHAPHAKLVRRPIILVRLDFLREQYRRHGGLGATVDGTEFLGGKQLPEIPPGAFRVFVELESRRARLRSLRGQLRARLVPHDKEPLERERIMIEDWLRKYERMFAEAQTESRALCAGPATTFCPVTFKSLELAFRHRVLGV